MSAGPGTRILVMRHGPAEALGLGHEGDAARRLTPLGRERTEQACAVLSQVLPEFGRVYTSPFLRARETADMLAAALSLAAPQATPLLAPGFDRHALARMLAEGDGRPVAIVGHEPDLSAFVAWLSGARVVMDKGTACLLELAEPGTAQIHAVYPQEALLNMLGGD
jgi:phosphohistidine phosphatase